MFDNYQFLKGQFLQSALFLIVRSLCNDTPKRIGNKRTAPEFHGAILFKPNTVHTHHMHTICNCMTALYSLPCIDIVLY